MDSPFYMVLEIPGSANVIQIINTAALEFPFTERAEAYTENNENSDLETVIGRDSNEGFVTGKGSK